jgi:hypothetical protein
LNRQGEARVDSYPLHENRTGSACALVTTFLGTGQTQTLTQEIKQGSSRIDGEIVRTAVDIELHRSAHFRQKRLG